MAVLVWDCNSREPKQHPFHCLIKDTACGYDHKLTDMRCIGCHRRNSTWPQEQIAALSKKK